MSIFSRKDPGAVIVLLLQSRIAKRLKWSMRRYFHGPTTDTFLKKSNRSHTISWIFSAEMRFPTSGRGKAQIEGRSHWGRVLFWGEAITLCFEAACLLGSKIDNQAKVCHWYTSADHNIGSAQRTVFLKPRCLYERSLLSLVFLSGVVIYICICVGQYSIYVTQCRP